MKSNRAALAAAMLMGAWAGLGAPRAHAKEEGGHTYGTTSTKNYVVQAYAFKPLSGSSATFVGNGFDSRSCTSPCNFFAPVMLPAGAVIVGMELEACDTDAVGDIDMNLVRVSQLEAAGTLVGGLSTAAAPGCTFFVVPGFVPHAVDNETGTYQLRGHLSGNSAAQRFQAVRIVYGLEVSAGPATATFPNDVPTTHPFFRFVEALAAAGITGGCSAGSFCPNDPVTRAQMAVFLATALGLHFPN